MILIVNHFFQYFTGNRDQNSIVHHGLYPNIKAYIIRVHPWGWYRHISMRVEFYGCTEGENTTLFLLIYTILRGFFLQPKFQVHFIRSECKYRYFIFRY